MTTRRQLAGLACATVFLTACGGGGSSAPPPPPAPPAPPPPPPPLPPPAPPPSPPGAYRWGNVAMGGGGFVSGIVASRTQRDLVYARTDVGGAYRWDAAGGRWVPLMDGTSEADVGLLGVESMALDPNDSAVLYVLAGTSYFSGGKTAVLRSSDRGASFSQVTDVSAQFHVHGNGLGRGAGEKMQVDPGDGAILYVGSRDGGLFRSTDAGASFVRLGGLPVTTTPNGAGISFVLLDPSSISGGQARRLFVGVSRFGVDGPNLYRSDDAGASFTAVAGAPAGFIPQRAAFTGDGHLLVTYGNGAGPHGEWSPSLSPPQPMDAGMVWKYRLEDGHGTDITPAGFGNAFSGVTVDPQNPDRVLVSTTNTWLEQRPGVYGDRFFLSINGGATWTDVVARGFALDNNGVTWVSNNSIHWASCIEFDPFDTRVAWVNSGNGLFRAGNLDATTVNWVFTVRGLEETVPLDVVSVPGGPLLSVIGDYDGFRHTDIDAYAPIHTPRMGSTGGLSVAPDNTSVAVRASVGRVYRSANTGSSWTEVPTMLPADSRDTTGSIVTLAGDGGALLHGITIRNGGTSTTTTYRSTNFASASPTWAAVSGLGSGSVRPAADPANADRLYAYDAGTGHVLVSHNGGASFTRSATLAAGGSTRLRAAPGREGDVWVALYGGGLARSTDAGASFTTLGNVQHCTAVGFGKTMTGTSFPAVFIWGSAGGGPRGLYRSTDAGATWLRINDDAHQFGGPGNGQFVVGDMNREGVVYMSTVGRGIVYGAPASDSP